MERRRGVDPYRQGVEDAFAYMAESVQARARRFGAESALGSPQVPTPLPQEQFPLP